MRKLTGLLAITLSLTGALAWAEVDSAMDQRAIDLRYCLDLPTDQQIANCAGEVSAGNKRRPFSKQEVEKILSDETARQPPLTENLSDAPIPAGDKPEQNSQPTNAIQD